MFPDGICRVSPRHYSKTIQFWDVNYQLAQQEDQTAIFDEWCSFLNFFDASIHFQFSFVNSSTDPDAFARSIRIPPRNDGFNDVRAEYSAMLRKQLAQGNNGLTKTKYLTFLVMNTGKDAQEQENNVFQAVSIAQKHNCALKRLDYQQEDGLMSCLPLASNLIEIQRNMTTSSTAIFIPFTTQELFQEGKESLYYGLNALSNNLIMVDRKKLKNPNGLILGTPAPANPSLPSGRLPMRFWSRTMISS